MKPASAVFIHSPEIEKYHYPPDSPFKTERAAMTRQILLSMGLFEGDGRREVAPRMATDDELMLFHTPDYIAALKRVSQGDLRPEDLHLGLASGDCPVFNDLFTYTSLATGGTIKGAELILQNEAGLVFNPSGGYHHAFPEQAGGFCYINDVVLGCKAFAGNKKRVFCLDLDAHHGNGTQAAFYDTPDVFTVSFHESGKTLFPWGGFEHETGSGAGTGYNVNVPLPAGTDDDLFEKAFAELVPPLIHAYRPDVLVLEIGMDILSVDPLTHLSMTNNILADSLPFLRDIGIPILAVGGGGYHPQSTARGWALSWTVLCDIEPETDLSIGMGGVFLGSSEWSAGLRDMRVYTHNSDRIKIHQDLSSTIATIKKTVFPIHDI